jgi:hypothetical protein
MTPTPIHNVAQAVTSIDPRWMVERSVALRTALRRLDADLRELEHESQTEQDTFELVQDVARGAGSTPGESATAPEDQQQEVDRARVAARLGERA